jgi:hypothetical protein
MVLNEELGRGISFVSSHITVPGVNSRLTFRHIVGYCLTETIMPGSNQRPVFRYLFDNFVNNRDRELAFERRVRPIFHLHDHAIGFSDHTNNTNRNGFEIIGRLTPSASEILGGNLFLLMSTTWRAAGQLRASQLIGTIFGSNGALTVTTNALRFVDNTFLLVTQQQRVVNRVRLHERPSLFVGCYLCTALATAAAIIYQARQNELNNPN